MAYSTDIKLDLMTTGSNSGTWGDKTNTNLQLIEEAVCGYISKDIAGGAGTTALTMTDGASSDARNMVISFTGTISGNRIVTIPNGIEKVYIFKNGTSGTYTVQVKGASDSGSGYTFSTTNKGTRILYMTGSDIVDTGFSSTAIDNVEEDTSPTLGGNLDVSTHTLISSSNRAINFVPNGTGVVQAAGSAIRVAGVQDMWVPAQAMKETNTSGCGAIETVGTAAGKPDMNVLPFDPTAVEFAQFNVAFPKSWNEGTVTWQPYWSMSGTSASNVVWSLQGVCFGDSDNLSVAFGTSTSSTDAGAGTAEDISIGPAGAATTIASAGEGEWTVFRLGRVATATADTATEDARLLGVKISFSTNAKNDA